MSQENRKEQHWVHMIHDKKATEDLQKRQQGMLSKKAEKVKDRALEKKNLNPRTPRSAMEVSRDLLMKNYTQNITPLVAQNQNKQQQSSTMEKAIAKHRHQAVTQKPQQQKAQLTVKKK